MSPLNSDVRMMIAVRVVVVTTLLFAALLIQSTVNVLLPINYLYVTAGLAYVLTLLYIVLGKLFAGRIVNLAAQLIGDLFIETVLVYFTGGIDSPFSILYLVTIITASTLLYRRGGLLAASGATIVYGALVDLMYYGVVPTPVDTFFSPAPWTSLRLYLTLVTNVAGFYFAALLTSLISEKLRVTFVELDANRRNLAELEALNQSVIQSVPSGLVTITRDGVINFINPAGREILGVTVKGIIGKSVIDASLFDGDQWSRLVDSLAASGIVRGETGYVRNDEPRTLGYAMTHLQNLPEPRARYTLIFQDLTEMKKLESQLQLKDRMAAVGELSAGIAHEIRNPLAAIAGSVQVLQHSRNLTSQEQRLMSIVLKESDRLNKSIADFLRFVRPQEKMASSFDIAASIGETLDLLQNSPELTPGHRILRLIQPPSFTVVADPDQIRQVFWNLARNALQAMPNGGVLEVTTAVDDGTYRIVFSDSGQGMSESDLTRLFQPFRTSFPSGTGLGMAISYRIVQEHGGRIAVDSTPGLGTKITISLPISPGQAPMAEATLAAPRVRQASSIQ